MEITYDKELDTILILWGENKPAVSIDVGGEFWIRQAGKEIIGIEIEDFKAFYQRHIKE